MANRAETGEFTLGWARDYWDDNDRVADDGVEQLANAIRDTHIVIAMVVSFACNVTQFGFWLRMVADVDSTNIPHLAQS